MVGKRTLQNGRPKRQQNGEAAPRWGMERQLSGRPRLGDVERGKSSYRDAHNDYGSHKRHDQPRHWRFRDVAMTALEDARREELKRDLLKPIDHDKLEQFRKSDEELKEIKDKKVREFYKEQNERLNDWLEVDAVVMALAGDVLDSMNPDPDRDGDHERGGGLQRLEGNIGELLPEHERERRAKAAKRARWAVNINVIANILLLVGKGVAALTTGSLSLIASLVDSALDLLCTLIVWSTTRLVLWRLDTLQKKFPVGRRRLEPLGILVFSIIMVISFAQILQESVERLMPPHGGPEDLGAPAIASLVATIVIKGIIGLGCRPIRTTQVQALVQDCKTDVVFNTLSLLFPLIGHQANIWWLDPAGAGILSLFIIYDWGHTSFENVVRLSGEAADNHTNHKLMYLAYRFSPVVEGIKSITAYHAGDGVWAEFDILLDENTKLSRAHDIAETLQYCAEGIGEVDRAFVSVDYAASGPTGHATDAEQNN